MKAELSDQFKKIFSISPEHVFFCPGRVNLIGEHIDYNGGEVMPCAISLGSFLAVSKNNDRQFRFRSLNYTETADLPLQRSYTKSGKEWFNYPLGVINEIVEREGDVLSGLDMLFYGNLPIGAGLSSSASIEVLMAYTLREMFGLKISTPDLAILSKKVENEFIGVNSGIMDQFAVAMGKKGKTILLNCDTLQYEYLPFETGDYILAIINSNKQRSLADSKYNERFAECREALGRLKKEIDAEHLCDISLAEFEAHRKLINDAVLEKRALHVISENDRVKKAMKALSAGDLNFFGQLMYASHLSLKELYEVSGNELDSIVEFAKTYKECIGARMTGAGFGGCAIALVRKNNYDDFSSKIIEYYTKKIGYSPEVFASEIGNGVSEL
jgi:galactokinase